MKSSGNVNKQKVRVTSSLDFNRGFPSFKLYEFIRQQIALAGYNTAYYLECEENLEVLDALIESGGSS